VVGDFIGDVVGFEEGSNVDVIFVGLGDGFEDGEMVVGWVVGLDIARVGASVIIIVGFVEGPSEGDNEIGLITGLLLGGAFGDTVGNSTGEIDGLRLGSAVIGEYVGADVINFMVGELELLLLGNNSSNALCVLEQISSR
jgi:hypothetical protein